jgi:AcrR family transcriptional regulator
VPVSTQSELTKPLRKDAARNRAALLEAARAVFAERGLEASLDDVAHRAGVGVGTAYRHFANKYELAGAILRESLDEILALAEECEAMDDPWAGLVRFLEGSCSAQAKNRGLHEVLMGMHDAELADEAGQRILGPLTTLVERAHESGALRADADVTDVGIMIVCLSTIADITGGVAPELWRRYLPMFLDSLRDGSPLPVPAVSAAQMHQAFASYKARTARIHR